MKKLNFDNWVNGVGMRQAPVSGEPRHTHREMTSLDSRSTDHHAREANPLTALRATRSGSLRRLIALTVQISLAIGLCLSLVTAAQAQVKVIGRAHIDQMQGYFRLQLKHGEKYLDADHCTNQVHMNPSSDWEQGACQLWRLVPAGDGWSRLQLKHGGHYLDAEYCASKVGINPGSDWDQGACQLWRLVPAGDGWFRLQLKHSGHYLDAEYCTDKVSMNPGSDWENGACQLWRLVAEQEATPAPAKPAIDKVTQWRCDRYAKIAVEQYQDSIRLQCNLGGPRWQGIHNTHYQWCTQTPESQVYAETSARRNDLERCHASKGVRIDP